MNESLQVRFSGARPTTPGGDSHMEVSFELFVPAAGQQDRVLGAIPMEVFIRDRESIPSDLSRMVEEAACRLSAQLRRVADILKPEGN